MDASGLVVSLRNSRARVSAQAAMEEISDQTGGLVYKNQNDIAHAVAISMADGNSYYSLAYVPENKKWDGSFRKIEVKVNAPNAHLRYRRGYFAVDPARPGNSKQLDTELMASLKTATLTATMVRFDARILPPPASRGKASVDVLIDPHTVLCQPEAEGFHCKLDFHVAAFSSDGKLAAHDDQRFDAAIPQSAYEKLLHKGFPFHSDLALASGNYQVRFAVRDSQTSAIGTLSASLSLP